MKNSKLGKIILAVLTLLIGLTGIILNYIFNDDLSKFWKYFITICSAILVFIGLFITYKVIYPKKQHLNVKQMSMVGIMSAITVVLYYFVKFNLPFFPPWLDIQISELPAMITGFAYGPYAGCMVILVRFILKLPATITAGVGEAADLILGLIVVGISSYIYKKNKTFKGAIIGTIIAMSIGVVLSCFINWLVLIPAYIYIAGFEKAALVKMLGYLPFEVTLDNFMISYVLIGVLPFNLFRYILVFILTFVLYKRTHKILNKITK